MNRLHLLSYLAAAMMVTAITGYTATPASPSLAPPAAPGSKVENFRLSDHLGRSHELYRHAGARAVVLMVGGNGCPIVRQSITTLKDVRAQFASNGVVFALLNANPQDDHASIVEEASAFSIDFPILEDRLQWVAKNLGLTRTAEVLAIDPTTWKIFYRGAIDDRLGYGTRKAEAGAHYLTNALRQFLAGEPIAVSVAPVKGCAITFAQPESKTISYATQVAPILQNRCVSCHSPGNIGPFAMSSHAKVRGWSSTIREVLLEQRMPPWHADPHYGKFANDRALTSEEANVLMRWIEEGSPRGEGEDPLVAAATSAPEWALGKPDHIIPLTAPQSVPATGVVGYRYIKVASPLEEDAWISAAVLRPGNRKVLHHALVFLQYPEHLKHLQPNYQGGAQGYFTGYVPGTEEARFPEGTGKFVPKGSTFIFQMHYTVTGKPETDLSEIGLYILPKPPALELQTKAATMPRLKILPGDGDSETTAEYRIKTDSLLYSMSPHMHLRGSRFRYEAFYPDGTSEVLLSVPHYDFNWQHLYRLATPKKLPANTRIVCRGAFDNSASNPANPDATRTVKWGDQSYDEMFIGYINYAALPETTQAPTKVKPALTTDDPTKIVGRWKVEVTTGDRTRSYDLDLADKQGKLEATLVNERRGNQKFDTVLYAGGKLTLEMNTRFMGDVATFQYAGQLVGDALSGTVIIKGYEAFGAGKWTATR